MDDDNYATVLENSVNILSLWVAKIRWRMYQGLAISILPRSGAYCPRKHLIWFVIPHNMVSMKCWINPCVGSSGQMIITYGTEDYCIMFTVIHCLHLGEAIGVHIFLSLTLAGNAHSRWSWVKPMKHSSFFFSGMGCHLQYYVTMPKKLSLVSLTGNIRRHHITCNNQGCSHHGHMQPKTR